jgi:hypothetical protein
MTRKENPASLLQQATKLCDSMMRSMAVAYDGSFQIMDQGWAPRVPLNGLLFNRRIAWLRSYRRIGASGQLTQREAA